MTTDDEYIVKLSVEEFWLLEEIVKAGERDVRNENSQEPYRSSANMRINTVEGIKDKLNVALRESAKTVKTVKEMESE